MKNFVGRRTTSAVVNYYFLSVTTPQLKAIIFLCILVSMESQAYDINTSLPNNSIIQTRSPPSLRISDTLSALLLKDSMSIPYKSGFCTASECYTITTTQGNQHASSFNTVKTCPIAVQKRETTTNDPHIAI